jgi:hypothetical protein
MYENSFVRLNLGFFSGKPDRDYHEIIKQHSAEGWRLVQIFDPGTGIYGAAKYFELVFEREKWPTEKRAGA